jgi:hypothetical protein
MYLAAMRTGGNGLPAAAETVPRAGQDHVIDPTDPAGPTDANQTTPQDQ